jgi:hypothetical protein
MSSPASFAVGDAPAPPRLRACVLGLGLAGRFFHVPHLAHSRDFEVVSVVQRGALDAALAADLAALAPRARVERDALAALAAPDVDVVVVATPDATHAELAAAALRAGKHVLVDKPLVQTLGQAAALFALARSREGGAGRLACMPYQNRRHCGDFMAVVDVLRARRVGELVEFASHYDRFRPAVRPIWKELDRGALDNLGPHVVDQALLLFGEPARVFADIRALRAGAVTDDAFELQLFYDGGADADAASEAAAGGAATDAAAVSGAALDAAAATGAAAADAAIAASAGGARAPARRRRRRIDGLFAPPRWRCVLKSTMLAAANELKFVLHGTEGSFVKSGLDGQEAMLCAGGPVLPDGESYGVEPAHLAGTLTLASGAAASTVATPRGTYATMYAAFAAACRSPGALEAQEVPPAMALLLLRVLETARISAASGRVERLVEEPAT